MRYILASLFSCCLACFCEAATIDGPTKVELGTPAVFTIKDVPTEHLDKFDWQIFGKPDDAMVLDLADRQGNPVLVFWCKTPGRYAVIADVNVPPDQFELIIHEFVVGKVGPDPDPPPPPPSDLSEFTVGLVKSLDIKTKRPAVAKLFQDAIPKINSGKLRGSKAIVEAVSKPIAAMGSTKWQAFSSLLFQHLLNDLKLVRQAQWSDAYRQIVSGIGGLAR